MKLEQLVLNKDGPEPLTKFPFEDRLLRDPHHEAKEETCDRTNRSRNAGQRYSLISRRNFSARLAGATFLGVPSVEAQTRKRGGTIRVAFVGSPVKGGSAYSSRRRNGDAARRYDNLCDRRNARAEAGAGGELEASPDATVDVRCARASSSMAMSSTPTMSSASRILNRPPHHPRAGVSMVDKVEKTIR